MQQQKESYCRLYSGKVGEKLDLLQYSLDVFLGESGQQQSLSTLKVSPTSLGCCKIPQPMCLPPKSNSAKQRQTVVVKQKNGDVNRKNEKRLPFRLTLTLLLKITGNYCIRLEIRIRDAVAKSVACSVCLHMESAKVSAAQMLPKQLLTMTVMLKGNCIEKVA